MALPNPSDDPGNASSFTAAAAAGDVQVVVVVIVLVVVVVAGSLGSSLTFGCCCFSFCELLEPELLLFLPW